ncbi:DUF397 domain-containing protein [Streptomyces sp. Sge12]|uniref:DUF397 domain-containing protein n=1 Tax=Streptomyces sp. Sge12 TaxID=1972846 RepID=UPI0009C24612|nr:DUF397 domain-containing protein [Streptomyces sp. Sge12]ARE75265.1 DUF397 domain-containing protein [Streptomyces sp. Sge12]
MSTELTWFKSSYSGSDGGNCLEVAVAWRTYSAGEGGDCVEVAASATRVHVRDSKVHGGPVLDLAPASWAQLTGWVSR